MKKKIAWILVLALALFALAGCGGGDAGDKGNADDGGNADAAVKTGYAVLTSADNSVDAGEKDGLAQVDSVIVAVTVDADGVIQNCYIDAAQTQINFSAQGKVVTPLDTVVPGKQELGTGYGMGKASSIGKEWNEQATALSNYAMGKTVADLKGIAVDGEGHPTGADLASQATFSIGSFVDAIEKAVGNAKSAGASAGDKLGIGLFTTIDSSEDAGEGEGLAQVYTNLAVATFDEQGAVTSCFIDAIQTNINFTADGKITTDLAGPFPTKDELGAAYGMAKASSIGMEWNEQAAAFAAYALGKTAAEVKGIALTDDGRAADADLSSSVTVHVGPFMDNVAKAYAVAK